MKYSNYPTSYGMRANTVAIDKHLNERDQQETAETYVYDKMVSLFKDQLEEAICIEDVHDDLSFETEYLIERDAWDVEAESVLKRIYSDYNLEGCK